MSNPYLPAEEGIVDKIQDALLNLLTEKLTWDIPDGDASKMVTIKIGPRQDDPDSFLVLIHENDPFSPAAWPHRPLKYRTPRDSGGILRGPYDDLDSNLRTTSGYQLVGGGSRMARAFTIELQIWGDELPLDVERRDVGQLASVTESRIMQALDEAGPRIGCAHLPEDDFGEKVLLGPFWGDAQTPVPENESMRVYKHLRLYYVTRRNFSTAQW